MGAEEEEEDDDEEEALLEKVGVMFGTRPQEVDRRNGKGGAESLVAAYRCVCVMKFVYFCMRWCVARILDPNSDEGRGKFVQVDDEVKRSRAGEPFEAEGYTERFRRRNQGPRAGCDGGRENPRPFSVDFDSGDKILHKTFL